MRVVVLELLLKLFPCDSKDCHYQCANAGAIIIVESNKLMEYSLEWNSLAEKTPFSNLSNGVHLYM